MAFDKTLNMLIFDGDPNGMIMCELSNWNGRVYKVSRKKLNDFYARKDSSNTGVYFLLGKDDEFKNTIYIGEAEEIKRRLKQHIDDENYWSECVAVITKDNYLNKAHVKYLENKFYNIAKEVDRYKIVNATVPTCSDISEYDELMLKEFMSYARLLVNTLGFKVFESMTEDKDTKNTRDNTEDVFFIRATRNADATGKLVSDGFVVLKGSTMADKTVNSFSQGLIKNRERLIEEKIVDNEFKFVKDYIFTSPSLAAAIVMGRNANGRIEWKIESRKTIKDIEEQQIQNHPIL